MPGDTILVHNGVYYEHIDITKSISLIGEDSGATIIDGNGTSIVVEVSSNDVLIRGFTVRNGEIGIRTISQANLAIRECNISKNSNNGIFALFSSGTTIQNNIIEHDHEGILVSESQSFSIEENEVFQNDGLGISTNASSYGLVVNNKVHENALYGIFIPESTNCAIFGNNVSQNLNIGISVEESSSILVYDNNIIDNIDQAYAYPAGNWNYSLEGNYWSNYHGNDTNYDGTGDQPHYENFTNPPTYVADYHPLMGFASCFNTSEGYFLNVVSNSTIVDFSFFNSNSSMRIHVTNSSANQTAGFCRVRIPHNLLGPPFNATVDGVNPSYTVDDDGENRWISFQYPQSASEIIIKGSDVVPPKIVISSPESKVYVTNSVSLTFIVSEPTTWIGYSLDNHANVTILGNSSLTSLNDGMHSVVVYANDTVGNMGQSSIISFTIDTAPPGVTVLSPENSTYATTSISLNFTVDEPTSWIGYQLDTQGNVTVTGNETLSNLAEGNHKITVYANDTNGLMGHSATLYFVVDTVAPTVQVISPENKTYTSNSLPLNITTSENFQHAYYSLDGTANVTVSGNTTLTSLPDGSHRIRVYVEDEAGNIGVSVLVYFTVNTQQEGFPVWILAAIGAVAIILVLVAGVYFLKIRKTK
jgi:parallel beta-helix repeat protein